MSQLDGCTGDHKPGVCGDKQCKRSFASSPRAKYWSKDNELKPWEVSKASDKKCVFDCNKCNHTFTASLNSINTGSWCPYCAHNPRLCDNENCKWCNGNSFKTHYKAKYWSKINKVEPWQVTKSSGNKYAFDCNECKHTFTSVLSSITNGCWCPYCSSTTVLCDNKNCSWCNVKSFKNHPKSKYWSSKNKLEPWQVSKSTHKKFYFDCSKCKHTFISSLNNITKGKWCPYCVSKKFCDKIDCSYCFSKSFASHSKAKYWSKQNKISPYEVAMSSNKKFYFYCNKCKHTFSSTLNNVTSGKWCHYCSVKTRLCDKKECNWCNSKSFANHPRAKYWSISNKVEPWQVTLSSDNKYMFDCNKCKHTFKSDLSRITRGRWCPYCSSNTQLCENKDCNWCYKKSFASHPKAKYWSSSNNLLPWQVTLSSGNKYIFDCKDCKHSFSSSLSNISKGQWCPRCKNKTEKNLGKWLDNSCKYEVIFQPTYEWCRNIESNTNRYFPFDYSVEKYKLIIELDGEQHFKQVSNWQTPVETLKRDLYKTQCALKNGYTIIRLLQMDVFKNKNNWEERLLEHLRKHSKPQVILLDNDGEYDPLRKALSKSQSYNSRTIGRSRKTRVISVSSSDEDSDNEPEYEEPKRRKKSGMVGKAKTNYDNIKSKRSS